MPDNQSNKRSKSALVSEAREVLRGKYISGAEMEALYKELESYDQFDYASEVLLCKMSRKEIKSRSSQLAECQTLVKYIYKDNSLPSLFKFQKAIQELDFHDFLAQTDNCETLGLAGAIYKRLWQHDHQAKQLLLACFYYERGYRLWQQYLGGADDPKSGRQPQHNDNGYNAINYAYIQELIATNKLEEVGKIAGFNKVDDSRLITAQETRKYILEQFIVDPFSATVPQLKDSGAADWVLATIAEAYFGLCLYDNALLFIARYLDRKRQRNIDADRKTMQWELRSFSQQLFSLAYLQQIRQKYFAGNSGISSTAMPYQGVMNPAKITECLNALDIQPAAAGKEKVIKMDGKTGLALSGGGFRASLFHIGVLAALAEKDELRDIEVISCVSGGSIIGAYYYLKLKILLEKKKDDDITRDDYITLVREIEEGFLKGVKENLRMRIFSNLPDNFRMLSKNFSRTNRLGKLYEEYLYRPILEAEREKNNQSKGGMKNKDAWYERILSEDRPIYMDDLFINPADEGFDFNTDNWKRKNKVPQLVLNATSLNTGHNWRFTASWMGEPATGIIADIDVKPRLRRMYYKDAPDNYKKFRLGYAVGASSCVPVMFEPLPMYDLYPGIDLQLIDGGLHDNQGITALIDEECRNMIVSDASGQLPTNNEATGSLFSLFIRADNILQERVRELQFVDIKERNYTLQVNKLYTVHMKSGTEVQQVNWKNCTDPKRKITPFTSVDGKNDLMPYGVLRQSQHLISEIRTDLDAFHDTEAYALMYSGYRQMTYELERKSEAAGSGIPAAPWNFLAIKDFVTIPAEAERVSKLLTTANRVPFKLYHLITNKFLKVLMLAVGLVIVYLLLMHVVNRDHKGWPLQDLLAVDWTLLNAVTMTGWKILWVLIVFVLGFFIKSYRILFNFKGVMRKWFVKICVALLGCIVFKFYVCVLNGWYLHLGKVKKKA